MVIHRSQAGFGRLPLPQSYPHRRLHSRWEHYGFSTRGCFRLLVETSARWSIGRPQASRKRPTKRPTVETAKRPRLLAETTKLSAEKAMKRRRGGDPPKSKNEQLDEKIVALDDETKRTAQRLRLERHQRKSD